MCVCGMHFLNPRSCRAENKKKFIEKWGKQRNLNYKKHKIAEEAQRCLLCIVAMFTRLYFDRLFSSSVITEAPARSASQTLFIAFFCLVRHLFYIFTSYFNSFWSNLCTTHRREEVYPEEKLPMNIYFMQIHWSEGIQRILKSE